MKQPKIKILIVDDDQDQVELMQRYLHNQETQWQLEGARSGPLALEMLATGSYDLVFLDYKMPQMDGLEVLANIRDKDFDVPVIMVTGMGDERIAVSALKAGAYDYITKAGDYFSTLPYIIKNTLERCELKRVQHGLTRRLKESEEKYRTLFEDSPISLWEEDISEIRKYLNRLKTTGITDFRSYFNDHPEEAARCVSMVKILNVNKATLDLYQAGSADDFKDGLTGVLTRESYAAFKEMLIALAEGKSSAESETVNQTLKGEKKIVALKWSTSAGTHKNGDTIMVSVTDITQIKAMERERDNLVSMVAHDLKSGLVAIHGFGARLLKLGSSADPIKLEKYVGIIKKVANRLEYLVNEILEYSILRRGKLNFIFNDVSLERELQEIYEAGKIKAQQQGVVLRFRKNSPLPSIQADAGRLNRVFNNLLDNALKYTRTQGAVTIAAWQENSHVHIRISDEGEGIEPAELPFIFDPFRRGRRVGKSSGHGVGLATVKAVVEGHNGRIVVDSHPDKGSDFTLILPLSQEQYNN